MIQGIIKSEQGWEYCISKVLKRESTSERWADFVHVDMINTRLSVGHTSFFGERKYRHRLQNMKHNVAAPFRVQVVVELPYV